jgi:aspartate/methionine/tyrosine aminotransferase
LPQELLTKLFNLAAEKNTIVLSDEVYRPVFHSILPTSPAFPSSLLSVTGDTPYANVIVTGSMSKAYALAGIRVGWIASRSKELIEQIHDARHYTTISVSQIDSKVAAFALSRNTVHKLLGRNIALARENLQLLSKWVDRHDDIVSWVKPLAGTTAWLRFHRDGKDVDGDELCLRLVKETGVLWGTGSSFGPEFKSYARVGYVCETDVLKEGLDKVKLWLKKNFDDVPLL